MQATSRVGCDATQHGTYLAYTNHSCRCEDARADWRRHKKQVETGTFQPLRINATGTRRRLQGLLHLGWSYAEIGRRLGVGKGAVHQWANRPQVRQSTADKVKELCSELEVQQPPSSRAASVARAHARVNGWPPPAAWDNIDDPASRHAPVDMSAPPKVRSPRYGQKRGRCVYDGCLSLSARAGLCKRHGKEVELKECGYPGCEYTSWRSHCDFHEQVGMDFAAGSWFDWVAVDQMYAGRYDKNRRPTVPEVLELIRRASRDGLLYVNLAQRMGITTERLDRWRFHADRIATASEVAA
jgi:hypothetical protein